MLGSVVAALIGIAGAGYCLIISALALERGPRCQTSSGWSYPFENTNGKYVSISRGKVHNGKFIKAGVTRIYSSCAWKPISFYL